MFGLKSRQSLRVETELIGKFIENNADTDVSRISTFARVSGLNFRDTAFKKYIKCFENGRFSGIIALDEAGQLSKGNGRTVPAGPKIFENQSFNFLKLVPNPTLVDSVRI